MNKDTLTREYSRAIRSKYFVETAMDESLTEFQEPKKKLSGPKSTKPVKPRKAPKRIRGQKDIRAALKSKKELESYAKDFDNVCKHAGLNVDSEELQLAIALSKSLQQTPGDSPEISQLSSQDRVGKIRTTLLEYGFKVPEIKIKPTISRRLKKKKNYKLLLTSDEGKQQIIADKYSQVLFQNITIYPTLNPNLDTNSSKEHLYYLGTNAPYTILKSKDTYYVDGLLEKSESTGNLLRDWADIPGRPVSPKICETKIDFSEMDFRQEDLDVILSGTLKSCKNVVKSYLKIFNVAEANDSLDNSCLVLVDDDKTKPGKNLTKNTVNTNEALKTGEVSYLEEPIDKDRIVRSCSPDLFQDESSVFENLMNVSSQRYNKSPSHNQEVSELIHLNNEKESKKITGSQPQLSQNTRYNDFMEITDCVEVQCLNKIAEAQFSQNKTKRKTNDFMEITNCVESPVQPLQIDGEIDLTKSPEHYLNIAVKSPVIGVTISGEGNVPNESNRTKHGEIAYKDVTNQIITIKAITEDKIDLTQSPEKANKGLENMDLTQSSNTSDELPFVCLNTNKQCLSLDETIIMDPKEYENISKINADVHTDNILDLTPDTLLKAQQIRFREEQNKEILDITQNSQNDIDIDLTQNIDRHEIMDLTQEEALISRSNSKTNVSFFEEYVHNHSGNNEHDEINCNDNLYNESSSRDRSLNDVNPSNSTKHNVSNDIDLTQSSNSSNEDILKERLDLLEAGEDVLDRENENDALDKIISKCSQRCSSLGKKDDVSIDYDDLYNSAHGSSKIMSISATENLNVDISNTSKRDSVKSTDISNCSQNSEVFVISDNELDYSMHKSKLEMPVDNFVFGGISIMDELSELSSLRTNTVNNSACANNTTDELVEVIINSNEVDKIHPKTPVKHKRIHELATPQTSTGVNVVFTPNDSEYSVNTNATPMPNYESMSLFEIHKELDQFGVKPFKRKRAIQLLTHIYNQTHPTVESLEESPSKRRKNNDGSPKKVTANVSPRKIISPIKSTIFPADGKSKEIADPNIRKREERLNNDRVVNQNYECSDVPVIKEVECSSEDWVFQKREKAKVHSCRVPLHIAFYNYVSSRRALKEAILCYEPINIDDVHKDLVAYGHRYDPKDLLKFMDKKCITVKTTDNDARNHKP